MGNTGELVSGSVQWMTAGRGVVHSEMPQQESGRLHGFQLWVNLPAADKLCAPNYREFQPAQIPTLALGDNSHAKVIAGELIHWQHDQWQSLATGPVAGIATAPLMVDLSLTENLCSCSYPQSKACYMYIRAHWRWADQPTRVEAQQMALLSSGEVPYIKSDPGAKALLLAGKPLNEPIANWGPL